MGAGNLAPGNSRGRRCHALGRRALLVANGSGSSLDLPRSRRIDGLCSGSHARNSRIVARRWRISALLGLVTLADVTAQRELRAHRLWLYALPNLSISMLVMPIAVI